MRHRIRSGQFRRRLELLKQALEKFEVPRAEFEKIVAHNEGLAAVIMRTLTKTKRVVIPRMNRQKKDRGGTHECIAILPY